jgi:hypothetical protein
MDTQNAKGKVLPSRSNLQTIGDRLGCKGQARPSLVVQGAKALTAFNRRTVGRWVPRESEVSLRSWGVGEQERTLTGDETAIRCADTFHPRRNLQRRSWSAWGYGCVSRERDATGERSVSLAKMCETQTQFVVTHTSCGSRYRVIWLLRSR